MAKKFLGIFISLILLVCSAGADKSKKAYELIYQDVQALKQKILQLEERIKINSENIKDIKKQLEEVLSQLRFFQIEQAAFKEDLRTLPSQYQILLEKLGGLSLQLIRISEELLVIKSASVTTLPVQEENIEKEQAPVEKKIPEQVQKEESLQPPPISLSPQEVYNMALSDYRNGNFDLAIDGFKIYREQFWESPLVDNAQYWIGECYFSQRKFEEAIEEFNNLILNHPNGDKVPAAYLKKGMSLQELGKKVEALSVFKLLISKYPLSEETKLAQQKIKELSTDNERYKQP